MSWPFVGLLVLVMCVQGALIGWTLARWRRGRRIGTATACGRCEFELGLWPRERCPECGCDLARVWPFVGTRRPARRFLAIALVQLVCLAVYLLAINQTLIQKAQARWMAFESVLMQEARQGDSGALAELSRRIGLGQVSDSHLQVLVREGLERQGERTGTRWAPGWGDLIETAEAAGRLTRPDWERYCRQAFPVVPEYFTAVGAETPLVGCMVGPTRTGATGWAPWPRMRVVSWTVPGQEPVIAPQQWASVRGGASSVARIALVKAEGGGSSARVRLRVEAMDRTDNVVTSWEVEEECGAGPMR